MINLLFIAHSLYSSIMLSLFYNAIKAYTPSTFKVCLESYMNFSSTSFHLNVTNLNESFKLHLNSNNLNESAHVRSSYAGATLRQH